MKRIGLIPIIAEENRIVPQQAIESLERTDDYKHFLIHCGSSQLQARERPAYKLYGFVVHLLPRHIAG